MNAGEVVRAAGESAGGKQWARAAGESTGGKRLASNRQAVGKQL